MKIINLDENVLRALNFFTKNKPPKLNLNQFKFPLVIGSGNAYNTGSILFQGRNAILADESNVKSIIKTYAPMIKNKTIKEALVISASGEKDSVWEIELAKKYGLKTSLLTCEADSSSAKIADKVYVYKKIAEPYTYNVSTYLGMILSATQTEPEKILSHIKKIKLQKNFKKFQDYAFVLPDEYGAICPMLKIKGDELFGPHLSLRAFPDGHARHAKFINRWDKESIISFGIKNKHYGDPKSRWDIKLPAGADSAFVFSLAYFLIGKIQSAKPPYFKKNIANYCQDYGPKAYGKNKPFDVIVPGN
jgi:hypothetical protein